MKKLITLLLYFLFVGLCACGRVTPPGEKTTTNTTSKTTTIEQTTETKPPPTFITTTDPYAYLAKACLNFFETESQDYSQHADILPKDILVNLYTCLEMRTDSILQYALYDIDGNGTKEFLLGGDDSFWGKYLLDVFTIQDGAVVHPERLRISLGYYDAPPSLFENGTIRTEWDNEGPRYYCYYRFEDGVLKQQEILYEYGFDHFRSSVDNYGPLGTSITKEEFDRLQKEFEGDGQVVELDWKPLAEYGR